MSRADFIALVVRFFDFESDNTDSFLDVEAGMYYAESVAAAKDVGIIMGIGNNEFDPLKNITRQDMMVIYNRALQVSRQDEKLEEGIQSLDDFVDRNDVSNYAVDSVNYMISTGIINGHNYRIHPKATSSRAEVAQMLYNLLKLK